jgi:hypothetical protein
LCRTATGWFALSHTFYSFFLLTAGRVSLMVGESSLSLDRTSRNHQRRVDKNE